MKRSIDRILTTHVGSLPRPNDLVELYRTTRPKANSSAALAIGDRRRGARAIRLRHRHRQRRRVRQSDAPRGRFRRVVVLRLRPPRRLRAERGAAAKKGRAAWTFGSKERKDFAEFYAEEASAGQGGAVAAQGAQAATSSARMYGLTCTAPVKYTGQAVVQRDIDNLKAALGGSRRARRPS